MHALGLEERTTKILTFGVPKEG